MTKPKGKFIVDALTLVDAPVDLHSSMDVLTHVEALEDAGVIKRHDLLRSQA